MDNYEPYASIVGMMICLHILGRGILILFKNKNLNETGQEQKIKEVDLLKSKKSFLFMAFVMLLFFFYRLYKYYYQ